MFQTINQMGITRLKQKELMGLGWCPMGLGTLGTLGTWDSAWTFLESANLPSIWQLFPNAGKKQETTINNPLKSRFSACLTDVGTMMLASQARFGECLALMDALHVCQAPPTAPSCCFPASSPSPAPEKGAWERHGMEVPFWIWFLYLFLYPKLKDPILNHTCLWDSMVGSEGICRHFILAGRDY